MEGAISFYVKFEIGNSWRNIAILCSVLAIQTSRCLSTLLQNDEFQFINNSEIWRQTISVKEEEGVVDYNITVILLIFWFYRKWTDERKHVLERRQNVINAATHFLPRTYSPVCLHFFNQVLTMIFKEHEFRAAECYAVMNILYLITYE